MDSFSIAAWISDWRAKSLEHIREESRRTWYLCELLGFRDLLVRLLGEVLLGLQRSVRHLEKRSRRFEARELRDAFVLSVFVMRITKVLLCDVGTSSFKADACRSSPVWLMDVGWILGQWTSLTAEGQKATALHVSLLCLQG